MKRTAPPTTHDARPPGHDASATTRGMLAPIAPDRPEALDAAPPTLPADHPAWQRDVISISARTRAVLASLRPIAVRVKSFWDHAVHALALGSRTLEIDPSGSYRLR